jgi:hypothetical protein
MERHWFRHRRFDYYFPELANIGEQPVYEREIYVQKGAYDATSSQSPANGDVFGYQEAWADYRYKPNRTSGYMRSTVTDSLDSWHYGDDFSGAPVLNSDFMKETPTNVDRTLAVSSSTSHQFLADFYFKSIEARPMPVYSIPGLNKL